jgi:hypothetical protein
MKGDKKQLQALAAESQRLRIQFLNRELELAATFIALGRTHIERGAKEPAEEEFNHVRKAIAAIHKSLKRVKPEQREKFLERVYELEAQALQLTPILKPSIHSARKGKRKSAPSA